MFKHIPHSNNIICSLYFFIMNREGKIHACAWDMQYECVMGRGKAFFIKKREQKIHALNIIMKQYSDREWIFPLEKVDKTVILQVQIETVSAKSNMKEKI